MADRDKNARKLEHALLRLKEAMDGDRSHSLYNDALIQRFEFCTELFWKTLKDFLARKEVEVVYPMDALKAAWAGGWLEGEEKDWLRMLRDRNLASHTYDEPLAAEVAARVPKYYDMISRTFAVLKERFG